MSAYSVSVARMHKVKRSVSVISLVPGLIQVTSDSLFESIGAYFHWDHMLYAK